MIARGTTPTIEFTFSTIDPADIDVCYLTIKQSGTVVIERDLDTATVGEESITWVLTQAETLSLAVKAATVEIRYRLTNDMVYKSRIITESVENTQKEGVI